MTRGRVQSLEAVPGPEYESEVALAALAAQAAQAALAAPE